MGMFALRLVPPDTAIACDGSHSGVIVTVTLLLPWLYYVFFDIAVLWLLLLLYC